MARPNGWSTRAATVQAMLSDQIRQLRSDTAALIAAARQGPLDAPITACPGWTLARLCGHVGTVHRWVIAAMTARTEPDTSTLERMGDTPPGDYLAASLEPLAEALASREAGDKVWNWSAGPQVAGFWQRRVVHETLVHRWDAETAIGIDPLIPADWALDGIQEVFDVFGPTRLAGRTGWDVGGSIHLHTTDVSGEWMIRTEGDTLSVAYGHAKGDVAVRGTAADLLLMLWRRAPLDDAGRFEVFGDRSVMDRWLAVGVP